MQIVTAIIVQGLLVSIAFAVTVLRCWIRLYLERRVLTLPDYLVWGGWFCAVAWMACSIHALYLQIDHPLVEPDLTTDSVDYLKTVFIASYFFDIGLYLPKASLVAFYWWLIPLGFRRLRIAVYVGTGCVICAGIASLLTDTLIARPISNNWSIENQLGSLWNSYHGFAINWTLNFATDLILFGIPFFIINCLKLRRRQKIGLVGVFSLGMITIIISLSRFIAYSATNYGIDDASGNTWCTAEMCTAVIVVSLPSLKPLILQATPANTSNRSTSGYFQTGSGKPSNNIVTGSRSYVHAGKMDDELELVDFLDRKPSPSPSGTTTPAVLGDGTGKKNAKDAVMITTDVTVTREII